MFLFAIYIIGIFVAFGLMVLRLHPRSLAETIVIEVEALIWPLTLSVYLFILIYEAIACYKR